MSKLNQMSVKEILDNIGLNLSEADIEIILSRDNEACQKLREVREMAMEGMENSRHRELLQSTAVRGILIKFEDKVKKDYLVLITLYNLQREIEKSALALEKGNPDRIRKLKENRHNALKLLKGLDITMVTGVLDETEGIITHMRVLNSKELIEFIKSGKSMDALNEAEESKKAKLMEIDRKVGLGNLIFLMSSDEIRKIVGINRRMGEAIWTQIDWNSVKRYIRAYPEDNLFDSIQGDVLPKELELKFRRSTEYMETGAEALITNCKYVDIDRLLLLSAYKYIDMLEKDDGTLRIHEMTEDGVQKNDEEGTVRLIKELIVQLSNGIKEGTSIEVEIDDAEDTLTYTDKDLEKDFQRFQERRYVTKKESQELKTKLLSNQMNLGNASRHEVSLLDFTTEEQNTLMANSEENIIFMVSYDAIGERDLMLTLLDRGECSDRLFSTITKKCILSTTAIISLFELGIVHAGAISKIEDGELLDAINSHTKNMLREVYVSILDESKKTSQEEVELFNRYGVLYKALNVIEKSEEEIRQASFELISSFEDNLSDDILEGLYQFGIIPLESAADWGVNLTEMLMNNSIKPMDLKVLYSKGVIQIGAIRDVLVRGNLPYEEKLDLIYSTFDGESEEEYILREELTQLLETGEGYKAEPNQTGIKRGNGGLARGREFVTDPHARWKLISLLDKDYSKKFLPIGKEVVDGHRVFLLPNQDKIVIERMHERKEGRKVSAYGSATYIMDTEEFFKNMDDIIIDSAINRTMLRELFEEDRAEKIIHTKYWGEAIKRYFEIDSENERYTEEEIAEIDRAIANVVKSRKERE